MIKAESCTTKYTCNNNLIGEILEKRFDPTNDLWVDPILGHFLSYELAMINLVKCIGVVQANAHGVILIKEFFQMLSKFRDCEEARLSNFDLN
jgi:hypothetical protein